MAIETRAQERSAPEQGETVATRTGSTTIIVVNYNGGRALYDCLASLLAECGPHDQVVVVDNASTDGSADRIEELFPSVRLVRSARNEGFGAGNNLAARFVMGEYLAFLNPDAVAAPGWLSALLAPLQADPQVGLTTSKILLLREPERINTCGNDIHISGLTLCRGAGHRACAFAEPAVVGAISGAAFAMRRNLFEQLGGFDETFFLYMEDTDLSLRAALAGFRCQYVPDSVAYHDYRLRFGPRKTFYQERNRYLMLLKALRWRSLAVLLPVLVLAEGVTWGFVLLREPWRLMNKLRAYGWVVRHWGEIMEKRRQVQSSRQVSDRELVAGFSPTLDFEQTGNGLPARVAKAVFDPLFHGLRRLALAVIRW